ncbi:UPF0678 fatty acid-binding protein-like protein [Melia azedarach]|uniref:UPF0678 fatty acid-binding protein-like protein n=1 Tax=Melia azedarach TaxID=155640 RepID=A0ACC1X2N4_MELAZ|nr:UPF0678 fatty acid-binding protein-like protein [Melia azedarach]
MHAESGYLRPKPDGTIEALASLKYRKGHIILKIKLQSELVGNASKTRYIPNLCIWLVYFDIEIRVYFDPIQQKITPLSHILFPCLSVEIAPVREISRVFEFVNGELPYVVQMGTTLSSLQPHLKAVIGKF